MIQASELQQLAEEYGTPTFLFNLEELRARMQSVRELMGEKIKVCYSIKANPFLTKAMAEYCDRLEVCSPGELFICESLGVADERVVYSGVNKGAADIAWAIEDGVGVCTAESLRHLQLLEEGAAAAGRTISVIPRLSAGTQFGMSKEDLFAALEHRADYPHLELCGLHYFAGTQRAKLQKQREELQMLREVFAEIEDRFGLNLRRLEYGPGLPHPYFENEDFSDTLSPLRELAPDLQLMAQERDLTVEMGRFYVSGCGTYLTRVEDIKSHTDKGEVTNYVILDGGMNHVNYLGQIMGMKVPVLQVPVHTGQSCADGLQSFVERREAVETASETEDYALCGSLCTTADVLVRKVTLPKLAIGDTLAFCNLGAYSVTEGILMFLSRTMPRIVLVDRDADGKMKARLARDFTETHPLNTEAGN